MGKIPNNFHIIYGLAENFGWDEYERMDRQRNIMVRSPKADAFDDEIFVLYLGKKEKVIDPLVASLISSTDVIWIEGSPTTSPFTAKAICSRVSKLP